MSREQCKECGCYLYKGICPFCNPNVIHEEEDFMEIKPKKLETNTN